MAIPPEPIDSVLFDAKAVVVGEVVAVVAEGPPLPKKEKKQGFSDIGNQANWQRLTLRVDDVLQAGFDVKPGGTVDVVKPVAAYALSVGVKGDFLLGNPEEDGGGPVVLGRYGPDSYKHAVVVEALRSRR
jgi:hypothetical protein